MDVQAMDSLVKHLRCTVCHEYLRPPIVLTANASTICGNCCASVAPKNPKGFLVRDVALEQVLRKLSFPCNYKSEGCQERLSFGCLSHKEEDCIYRPLACPTKGCLWSGCMYGVQKHFVESHSAMVKKALNFKLQMKRDFEETTLVVIYKIPIVAKCVYNVNQRQLVLKINSLILDEFVYKIWMWNDHAPGSLISLKHEKGLPFASSVSVGLTLNMEKYLPALEEPEWVMVSVGLMIKKSQRNIAVVPPKPAGGEQTFVGVAGTRNMGHPPFAAYFPGIPIPKICSN